MINPIVRAMTMRAMSTIASAENSKENGKINPTWAWLDTMGLEHGGNITEHGTALNKHPLLLVYQAATCWSFDWTAATTSDCPAKERPASSTRMCQPAVLTTTQHMQPNLFKVILAAVRQNASRADTRM